MFRSKAVVRGERAAHSTSDLPRESRITHHASLQPSRESGVALVITLILLSVITFMAVTFLVITQAERKSVVTTMDQLAAKQAAEAGFQMAQLEILGPMVASKNLNGLSY